MNWTLWALQAALKDSEYLISPTARERALLILQRSGRSYRTKAAIRLLKDGGAWQGTGYKSPYSGVLDQWRKDVELVRRTVTLMEKQIDELTSG